MYRSAWRADHLLGLLNEQPRSAGQLESLQVRRRRLGLSPSMMTTFRAEIG